MANFSIKIPDCDSDFLDLLFSSDATTCSHYLFYNGIPSIGKIFWI